MFSSLDCVEAEVESPAYRASPGNDLMTWKSDIMGLVACTVFALRCNQRMAGTTPEGKLPAGRYRAKIAFMRSVALGRRHCLGKNATR
jgi:hypothetical protein